MQPAADDPLADAVREVTQQFSLDLIETLNGLLERLGTGEARILQDLAEATEQSAQRGTSAASYYSRQ